MGKRKGAHATRGLWFDRLDRPLEGSVTLGLKLDRKAYLEWGTLIEFPMLESKLSVWNEVLEVLP